MKTREINNKHYIDAKVVILDTDKQSEIYIDSNKKLQLGFNIIRTKPDISQHLYILSNEEIKEGDWLIGADNKVHKSLGQKSFNDSPHCKRIIATTDSSLVTNKGKVTEKFRYFYLPQPSKEFIQAWIAEYNNGKVIEDVLVEVVRVDETFLSTEHIRQASINGKLNKLLEKHIKLKDNTIIIKKKEVTWKDLKEELIQKYDEYVVSQIITDLVEQGYNPPTKK